MMLTVPFKKLNPWAKEPVRSSQYAAAFDLFACVDATHTLSPGEQFLCPTGIAIDLQLRHTQQTNLCALVIPRSGLGVKSGIVLANGTGLIDPDYRGEIMVALLNRNPPDPSLMNPRTFFVEPHARIAQLLLVPFPLVQLVEVQELDTTERAGGGFGSTGTR